MAEKQSLAAKTGTLVNAPTFQMPTIFQEPAEKVTSKFSTPYITFAHPNRKDEYLKLTTQFGTVNEGDMFLVAGNEITKLPTVKLAVLRIKQYWVETDPSGAVLKAAHTEKPWPWKEHMDVAAIALLETRAVVVNINPHTTKCGGFKALADALEECQKPSWGEKSPAHKETLMIGQPFMRFFGEVSVAPPRTSKKSGLPYRTTTCSIKPTTNVEANLLKAFSESPDSGKQMADAADRFQSRMAEIESKLVK